MMPFLFWESNWWALKKNKKVRYNGEIKEGTVGGFLDVKVADCGD